MTPPPAQKTYGHLLAGKRLPSRYEVATSRVLYYPARGGFEVELPLSAWYARHQVGSPLQAADWEAFADPLATTYTDYTRRRAEAEAYVEALLRSLEESGADARLSSEWLAFLEATLVPLRFAAHGFQMAAAYVGSMAPAGRIVIAAAFQAADEVRRIQRLAYRTAMLRAVHPGFGADARRRWQDDPAWQPLRRAIERLLVTYDWGEALVALSVCLKPRVDALLLRELAGLAAGPEPLMAPLLQSLYADCRWHESWALRLVEHACAQRPESMTAVRGWCAAWDGVAQEALAPFVGAWSALGAGDRFQDSCAQIEADRHTNRAALAVTTEVES